MTRRDCHYVSPTLHDWMAHVEHLAGDLGYVRACIVCNMGGEAFNAHGPCDAKLDCLWYAAAQASGRASVGLGERIG